MLKVILTIALVWTIIYLVPFLVYGLATVVSDLKPPEGASPARFLVGVLVSKLGTAVAFVLILYFAGASLRGRWVLYASVWWLMFVMGEIGQVIGPGYSWKEAIAGIISETGYWPLAAYAAHRLLG